MTEIYVLLLLLAVVAGGAAWGAGKAYNKALEVRDNVTAQLDELEARLNELEPGKR